MTRALGIGMLAAGIAGLVIEKADDSDDWESEVPEEVGDVTEEVGEGESGVGMET